MLSPQALEHNPPGPQEELQPVWWWVQPGEVVFCPFLSLFPHSHTGQDVLKVSCVWPDSASSGSIGA